MYVPYEWFHYTQICNYEHTEIPLYNSTCSSIAKFKASHVQDRRGGGLGGACSHIKVYGCIPVPTSKEIMYRRLVRLIYLVMHAGGEHHITV